ncbi:hypothetical protein HDU96_002144 [Phlyctochytrium bullatum]|nr:hypothetical protein HDU96_002144 [Phlyctochytrium bullatum]
MAEFALNFLNAQEQQENQAGGPVPPTRIIGRQLVRLYLRLNLVWQQRPDSDFLEQLGEDLVAVDSMALVQAVPFNAPGLAAAAGGQQLDQLGLMAAVMGAIALACQPGGPVAGAIQQACEPGGPVAGVIQQACEPGGPVAGVIQQACEPGGPVAGVIQQACEPGGPVAGVIQQACEPGGPVAGVIQQACQPNGPIHAVEVRMRRAIQASERRALARARNERLTSNDDHLQALPKDNLVAPVNFPVTVGAFNTMHPNTTNSLLRAYDLLTPDVARMSPVSKRRHLARHCGVTETNWPLNW